MSKYILHLIDKDPVNNQTIPCSSGQEVLFYKNKAIKMGFKVKVSKAKKEIETNLGYLIDEIHEYKGCVSEDAYLHKN